MSEIVLRPEIRKFAESMEMQMRKHDSRLGDGWKSGYRWGLFNELQGAKEILANGLRPKGSGWDYAKVVKKASDVGNFAMMLHAQASAHLSGKPLNETPIDPESEKEAELDSEEKGLLFEPEELESVEAFEEALDEIPEAEPFKRGRGRPRKGA